VHRWIDRGGRSVWVLSFVHNSIALPGHPAAFFHGWWFGYLLAFSSWADILLNG